MSESSSSSSHASSSISANRSLSSDTSSNSSTVQALPNKSDIDMSNLHEDLPQVKDRLRPLDEEPPLKKQNTAESSQTLTNDEKIAYYLIDSNHKSVVAAQVQIEVTADLKLTDVVEAIKQRMHNGKYSDYDFEIYANPGPSTELKDLFSNDGDVEPVMEQVKMSALSSKQLNPFFSLKNLIQKRALGSICNPLFIKMPDFISMEKPNVHVPDFDPSKFEIRFPDFDRIYDDYLTMQGRDDLVKKINFFGNPHLVNKYSPIIISTSRGMGKTFLLKMIGLQKVRPDLKNSIFVNAGTCGRILSFDFAKNSKSIQSEDDAERFPCRLMIYFLCMLFNGTKVDGICFEKIRNVKYVVSWTGRTSKFNEWLDYWRMQSTQDMLNEYIRLTNIAFKIDESSECYTAPPVFLLDEVQLLCRSTAIESKEFPQRFHTYLSLILTEFARCEQRPVSISTGTNNGSILEVVEMSVFNPQVFSLNALTNEDWVWNYWEEMTAEANRKFPENEKVSYVKGDQLINCLIYASYQIPRLLYTAHRTWFILKNNKEHMNGIVEAFETNALSYYREMKNLLTGDPENALPITVDDMVHIMLACGVHWQVTNTHSFLPGTKIHWSFIIEKSIVFPYMDGCYVFPFHLIWRSLSNKSRSKIEAAVNRLVPNLCIKDLFHSFDALNGFDLYHLGMYYEKLFMSSLAAKYYLLRQVNPDETNILFSSVYDFDLAEERSEALLSNVMVDFSEGIDLPTKEAFANQKLRRAVTHNRGTWTAHHDGFLYSENGNIPISSKGSLRLNTSQIPMQLKISKDTNEEVDLLIWLYLGSMERAEKNFRGSKFPKVAFLDGAGVCNGLAIDMLMLMKKLKSMNNRQ